MVPRQTQVSSELEIKASYEAALLVGGRVGRGVLPVMEKAFSS